VICVTLNAHYDVYLLLQEKSRSADTKMQTKNVNVNQASLNNDILEVSQPSAIPGSSYFLEGVDENFIVKFHLCCINPPEVLYCGGQACA
jgi:hypothetical protein